MSWIGMRKDKSEEIESNQVKMDVHERFQLAKSGFNAIALELEEIDVEIDGTGTKKDITIIDRIRGIDISPDALKDGLVKIGKTASGIQGIQDRKKAKDIRAISQEYYEAAVDVTEDHRVRLNLILEDFGKFRLNSLHDTVGRFLGYLKDMQQKNKIKEYQLLDGIGLDTKTIEKMETLDMKAGEALKSTAVTGVLGTAAALGTPALVTGTVAALATASTGTAISGLSGAAASNAVLAWLGGGSLAAGGGGVAAGTAVLAGITVGATAGVALLAVGTMASAFYAKKLTESKEYERDVAIAVAEIEKAWVIMNAIRERCDEMKNVTQELKQRTIEQLDFLEPLVPDFDTKDPYYLEVFQRCGKLVKGVGDLSQTPLLDNDGNISSETVKMIEQTHAILNSEVTHHE
jgi:hypothetical protein